MERAAFATTRRPPEVPAKHKVAAGKEAGSRRTFSLRTAEKKHAKEPSALRRTAQMLALATSEHIAKADAVKLLRKFEERSPLSLGTLRTQLISDSTWKRAERALGPAASQTVARLAHTLRFATRTWQSETDAIDWLLSPHSELGGSTPFSMLRTESGGREVEYLMAALEYGFSL